MRTASIRSWLAFAIAAVLAGTALLSAPRIRHLWSSWAYARRLGVARVISASGALHYRRVLARVSPSFDYRPFRRVLRGTIDAGDAELLELVAALPHADMRNEAAPSLQGAGIAMLMAGNPVQACALLDRALYRATGESNVALASARTTDARLLSDLAAAYYERGIGNDNIESILSAIDLATRASQLDPRLEIAAFNRAVAIERIHTPEQAIAAWNDYLRLDDAAEWRDEARSRITALESLRRNGDSKVDRASHIENELLPSWGAAFLRGDVAAAASSLSESSATAHELATCCGDDFYETAIQSVRRSLDHDPGRLTILANAYLKYREGYDCYKTDETTKSIQALEASRDALVALDDIFAVKPWRLAAVSYALAGEHERALHETDAALEYCRARVGCTATELGHLLWGRGLISGRLGDVQRANAEYAEALRDFESAHDLENAASVHALIASNLTFLGATEAAWPHLITAMHAAYADGGMRRTYIAYTAASDAARSREHWESTRLFEDVVVASERHEHNLVLLADSLLTRGQVTARVTPAEARRDFGEARRIASTIPDAGRQAKVLASAALSEAALLDPVDARRSLTDALTYYESVRDHYHLAEIYSERASAEQTMSMAEASEDDFRRCLDQLELERESIATSGLRVESFTRSSAVFDRVIDYFWSLGRYDRAFNLADESRGREFTNAGSRARFLLGDAARSLRAGEVLIEYAVLPRHILVWVVEPGGKVTWSDSRVRAQDLQSAVDTLQDDADGAIARLSEILWRPASSTARGAKRVIFVPNKQLRAVPFAALRDESTARFLVEDHEIVVAPSAAAYFKSVRHDTQLRQRHGSVVIAASTRGDELRKLPPLNGGAVEVIAVRNIYGARSVVEDGATPERFLESTPNATVVHVIAHALSNTEHAEYSSIVLDAGKQGRDLYASVIEGMPWTSTRIVFLSTCGTAVPAAYNDAPLTLPESFIAGGVPIVIASMAPVDDARATAFAIAFHRQFERSGDAVAALRAAQLQFLAANRSDIKAWSCWAAVGGSV